MKKDCLVCRNSVAPEQMMLLFPRGIWPAIYVCEQCVATAGFVRVESPKADDRR